LIQLRSDSTSVPEWITFSDFWPHANRPFRILGIGLELARNGGSCIWKDSPTRGISLSCKLGPIQCREYENGLLDLRAKKKIDRAGGGWGERKWDQCTKSENTKWILMRILTYIVTFSRLTGEFPANVNFTLPVVLQTRKLNDYRCSLHMRWAVKPSPKWKFLKEKCN